MSYVSLEKLLRKENSSVFKLTLTAAARANELAQGAQPLVKSGSKKVSTIALEEIAAGKVHYAETKPRNRKSGT
jgi:DNA-directed RNA polymerase omega subunit